MSNKILKDRLKRKHIIYMNWKDQAIRDLSFIKEAIENDYLLSIEYDIHKLYKLMCDLLILAKEIKSLDSLLKSQEVH